MYEEYEHRSVAWHLFWQILVPLGAWAAAAGIGILFGLHASAAIGPTVAVFFAVWIGVGLSGFSSYRRKPVEGRAWSGDN